MAEQATALPPALLQDMVDEAAHFNLYSIPERSTGEAAIRDANGATTGFQIRERLHRFRIETTAPSAERGMRASNTVGEPVARFTHRWMIVPPDYVAAPDHEPEETAFDPSASGPQRFVMLDSECRFEGGEDGFRGFGTGTILPGAAHGRYLVTAIGTILEGFGRFRGHNEGTYLYCGSFSPEHGFTGNNFLRVMDRDGAFHTDRSLPELEAWPNPEPDVTYLLFRGQAVPTDAVRPNVSPDGQPLGLIVMQGLRLLEVDCTAGGHRGTRSTWSAGQSIGEITATVGFNPAAPGGGNLDPIPFTTSDQFVFFDSDRQQLATMQATSDEGRVFNTRVGGAQAIRFGGVGGIQGGSDSFSGISGLMTDNSVVVFEPHVSASIYLLRVEDPDGRYRIG